MNNKPNSEGQRFGKDFFKFVILFLLSSCSQEDYVSPKEVPVQILTNVSYGSDPLQVYDIYLPENRSVTTTKVLIFIHGGGWVQGDKRDMNNYIPLMQEKHPDYAIVNLNYRLAQLPLRAAFPNQFLDLQAALKQITEDSYELQINPEYGLIGASAGGHIALQYDNLYDPGDQVKMVCSIVGPTNLTDPLYTQNPDFKFFLEFLVDESQYPGVQDFARAVSPAFFISEKSSPSILFYGRDDDLVPVNNGIFLKQQLDEVGVINSLTIYDGGHGDWKESDNNDLIFKLSNFINNHFPAED